MQNDELHIGEFDSNPFIISGSSFLTERTAVMGMSGSGKSYLIGVMCEELCKADLPFIIVDPEGEYKSLKEKFEVVWACNAPEADVQLNFQVCQKLAELAITKNLKLILDTSESSDEFEIVSEFLKQLYEIENRVRTPMLVIIEEADHFAPQSKGDNIREIHEISRRGRKRGIGLVIATQRPAMVDKNVLSQCGNQFIGRLRTENDLNAVSLFFRSRESLNLIPDLEGGMFYAMGGIAPTASNVKVRQRETTHGGGTPGIKQKIVELEELNILQKPKPVEMPIQEAPEPKPAPPAPVPEQAPAPPAPAIDIEPPAPKAGPAKETRRDNMEIDHFVWYPIHGKGYQDKPVAISGDLNPGLFTSVFKQEFAPLMMSYSQTDYKGFMLFNKPSLSFVIYSYVYHKVIDEFGRRGVIHHSAIIEKKDLASGAISILQIEKAMEKFDEENPKPKGDIPPLVLEPNSSPKYEYQGKIHKYISKAAAETLATRMLTSPSHRTSFRCKGADKNKRRNIAIYLAELLSFRGGIPISFCTERPINNEYYEMFNLTVTERAVAPDANAESWAVINWDTQEEGLRRLGGKEAVYKLIDEAFG